MDLSDWSNRSRKDFETIRDAIQIRHTISFSYCGSNGSQSKMCIRDSIMDVPYLRLQERN